MRFSEQGIGKDVLVIHKRRISGSWRGKCKIEKKEFAKELRANQTPAEKLLWTRLVNRRLGVRITRQKVILGWIADFYCGVAGLVIELDGSSHDGRDQQDAYRDRVMTSKGLIVMRFTNDRIFNDLDGVVLEIRNQLIALGYKI